MRVGSLFSGIGGIDLGLERAGMEIAWQVEIDEWCRRVLAKHWPDVERFADIRDVGSHNLAAVDVLAGGFPCQPVSVAGSRLAQADARWLWPEYARIVRLLRPRFVLVENVTGLVDRGFGDVLTDLAQSGYDAEWDCIPAAAVGAPHPRDRIFLVAYPAGSGRAERIFVDRCDDVSDHIDRTPAQGDGARSRRKRGADAAAQAVADHPQPRVERHRHAVSLGFARSFWRWRGEEDFRLLTSEPFTGTDRWPQPLLRRVDDGVPDRVERITAIGNAVVPQIVEWIGRRIMESGASGGKG